MENVKRIHTDGFISTIKIDEKLLGAELGDLRYEGYCANVIVKNMSQPIGAFVI